MLHTDLVHLPLARFLQQLTPFVHLVHHPLDLLPLPLVIPFQDALQVPHQHIHQLALVDAVPAPAAPVFQAAVFKPLARAHRPGVAGELCVRLPWKSTPAHGAMQPWAHIPMIM